MQGLWGRFGRVRSCDLIASSSDTKVYGWPRWARLPFLRYIPNFGPALFCVCVAMKESRAVLYTRLGIVEVACLVCSVV